MLDQTGPGIAGCFRATTRFFDRYRRLAQLGSPAVRTIPPRRCVTCASMVEDFRIDKAFVERKLERVRALVERSHGPHAERLSRAYLDLQQLVSDQDLVEASRLASAITRGAR